MDVASLYPLITCLIGSFSGLMALTAFHAFVIVHEDKIRSGFYKEFVRFFGKGGNLPVLGIIAVGIVVASLAIAGVQFNVELLQANFSILEDASYLILLFGWVFTIMGIFVVIIKYLREHYQIVATFKIMRKGS
jgi:flagellar biosynthesis protein FlhB